MFSPYFSKKRLKFIVEIILILFLILFSIIQSEKFLRGWHGPGGSITTDLYIPSIMFACGHGFTNVNPNDVPHLRAFLDFNQQVFLEEYVPEEVQSLDWDGYQKCHRYLIYTVGMVWRLFGVSWEVIRWLLVVLYATTVLIVYAIARVFLPSYLAVVVGYYFARAEEVLIILPILRDFARGLFILAVLLILFHLVRGKRNSWAYLLFCVLLGLTCGIGIGFRQELMMFFLISVPILFIVPRKDNVPNIPVRLAGIVTTVIVFLIVSYPILQAFQQFGTYGFHHILMGFATEHDDLAGLQRTNYERIYKYDDVLVSATADVHTYYHETNNDYIKYFRYNPELGKRKLFFSYIYWFPADMIIRAYSAIARISDRILTTALPINLYRTFLSLAVLVLFTAIDFRRGLCFSAILLYSMGIQTLQFNFRHCFYLAFIPYFLYLLPLYGSLTGATHLWQGGKSTIRENREKLISITKRFVVITVALTFFSLGFLMVARQIQINNLKELFNAYLNSEKVLLSYRTYSGTRGVVYALDNPLAPQLNDPSMEECFFTPNVIVIDFVVNQFPACFEAIYDGVNDFSYNLTLSRSMVLENTSRVRVRYFLPVYENMQNLKSDWNRFIGIGIEDKDKIQVTEMYKISSLEEMPLLINCYFLQDEPPCMYQEIAPYSQSHINPCWRPYGASPSQAIVNDAIGVFSRGDKESAYAILQKAMQEEPYYLKYGFVLADLYESAGEIDNAKETYMRLLSNRLYDPIPAKKLDTFLSRLNLSSEEKQQFWENVVKQLPEVSISWIYPQKTEN